MTMRSLVNDATTLDSDPAETGEWLEAFDDLLHSEGPRRCEELISILFRHANSRGVNTKSTLNTPYRNTVSAERQAIYPGDLEVERRITAVVRWNALAMVVNANRMSPELGGHLA